MNQTGTNTIIESTGNSWYEDGALHYYNGVNDGGVVVDAEFGRKAIRFDGLNDYVDCSRYYTRSFWDEFT